MRTRIALVAIIPVAVITVSFLSQLVSVQPARAAAAAPRRPVAHATGHRSDRLTSIVTDHGRLGQRTDTDTVPVLPRLAAALVTGHSAGTKEVVPRSPPPHRPGPDTVTPAERAAWDRVAMCEEGGNWHADDGALQRWPRDHTVQLGHLRRAAVRARGRHGHRGPADHGRRADPGQSARPVRVPGLVPPAQPNPPPPLTAREDCGTGPRTGTRRRGSGRVRPGCPGQPSGGTAPDPRPAGRPTAGAAGAASVPRPPPRNPIARGAGPSRRRAPSAGWPATPRAGGRRGRADAQRARRRTPARPRRCRDERTVERGGRAGASAGRRTRGRTGGAPRRSEAGQHGGRRHGPGTCRMLGGAAG